MDTGHHSPDDIALSERLARLRLFAETICAAVQALDMPRTFLEADQAARFVTVTDRNLQALPRPGDPEADTTQDAARRGLRTFADRLMQAAAALTLPASYLEGVRAGRYARSAERMLRQLYHVPKARTAAAPPARPAPTTVSLAAVPLAAADASDDADDHGDDDFEDDEDDSVRDDGRLDALLGRRGPPNDSIAEWTALLAFETARAHGKGVTGDAAEAAADHWTAYLNCRVPDYNPLSGAYQPDGDLNAILSVVSQATWSAISRRLGPEMPRGPSGDVMTRWHDLSRDDSP